MIRRWQDDIDASIVEAYIDGKTIGKKLGEKIGRRKIIVKTALRLLANGDTIEEIAEFVELPVESVKKIQRGEIFDIWPL